MKTTLIALALAAMAMPVMAQDHSDHSGAAPMAMSSEASTAYKAANMRMHEAMDVELTGDADVDFILSMLPHHQGAVDMARIVLEHGADPEVRKLAQDIVESQEAEIAWMEKWLADNGHAAHMAN